jgi:hypothetical protein
MTIRNVCYVGIFMAEGLNFRKKRRRGYLLTFGIFLRGQWGARKS